MKLSFHFQVRLEQVKSSPAKMKLSFHFQVRPKHLCQSQWGSEIQTRLDFKWVERGWVENGPDFEWDLKS